MRRLVLLDALTVDAAHLDKPLESRVTELGDVDGRLTVITTLAADVGHVSGVRDVVLSESELRTYSLASEGAGVLVDNAETICTLGYVREMEIDGLGIAIAIHLVSVVDTLYEDGVISRASLSYDTTLDREVYDARVSVEAVNVGRERNDLEFCTSIGHHDLLRDGSSIAIGDSDIVIVVLKIVEVVDLASIEATLRLTGASRESD